MNLEDAAISPVTHSLPVRLWLWHVDLDRYPLSADPAEWSTEERATAQRRTRPEDSRRYLVARHALRAILGHVTGMAPARLVFEAGPWGKPRLCGDGMPEFNVSHSAHECLIVVSFEGAVGVDVEIERTVPDAAALARRHFTEQEWSEWSGAAATLEQSRLFLRCWTRKEACLKAIGRGLSVPPVLVEVGCDAGLATATVSTDGGCHRPQVCSLKLRSGALAAVACTPGARTEFGSRIVM